MPSSDADPGDVEDGEAAEEHGQQRGDRADHDDCDGHNPVVKTSGWRACRPG